MIQIRRARADDDEALGRLDAATWTADVSPAPAPPLGTAFFSDRRQPEDTLVAELDGAVAGYALLRQSVAIPTHAHVLELGGLAVDPQCQRSGIGRLLVEATVDEARARGASKLSLRVLGNNGKAQRLYAACGFVTEGVLRSEFMMDGRYIDDVLMARHWVAQE
ncbi:MAG: GNAT family N-acetyltransferase [Candidatus Dormibacteraeota bacterium]|uniref:GNAT family N-acetyltransferase n=1 Tax=Candidatus Amunia macphersoniae TaxID=3127014 RepID=A0A934KJF3_9BACT|nr:GNAT family N-acetyltransferase [Candidatus Dormibacteraeota bacterium]